MNSDTSLDRIDLRILAALQADGRLSNLKLAELVALSPTATLARTQRLQREGYPCYTTSAGWLGYDDAKLRRLCQEAVDQGFKSSV